MTAPSSKRTHVFVAGSCLLLAVLILIVYYSLKTHLRFQEVVISGAQQQLASTAKSVSSGLYNEIDMLSDILDTLAMNEELQRRLKSTGSIDIQGTGAVAAADSIYRAHQSHIYAVYILDSRGRLAYRYPRKDYVRISESLASKPDVAHVLKERRPYVSAPFYSGSGLFVIGLSKPIFHQGDFVGIVRFLVRIDTLVQHFVSSVRVGQSGYAQLIDNRGILLAIPDKEQVGRHIAEKPKTLYPDRSWSTLGRLVREMASGREGTDIADLVCWLDDRHLNLVTPKLIAYAPVSLGSTPWTVIMTLDYEEVVGPIDANALSSIIFALLAGAAVLSAGYYLLKTQKKLIRLEGAQQFRLLFENDLSGVGLHEIVLDGQGTPVDYIFLQANPAFETHTGLNPADVIGKRVTQIYPGIEKTGLIQTYGKVASSGEPAVFEMFLEVTKQHYSVSAYPLGRGRFATVLENITERKLRDAELAETAQRLKLAIESGRVGVWDWNVRDNTMIWDDRMFELYGITRETFPNSVAAWEGGLHPKDSGRAIIECTEALRGDRDFDTEFRVLHPDGTVRWIKADAVIIRDNDGAAVRMLGLNRDITERKQAEEALRESEAKLSALFDSMTEMVVMHELVFDDAGTPVNYRITDCNAAFTKVTGIRREDAVGRQANEVYGTPEPPYLAEFSRVGITGESYQYETYFQPMDKHFAISVVSPGKNRFATITADISDAKRIQAVIDAKNKELEQLVYVVSHDLRSPLVNVDGFSRELGYSLKELGELLESGNDPAVIINALRKEIPDMGNAIGRIHASTAQMGNLLKAMLSLSRTSRTALQIGNLDMNQLLGKLAPSFAYRITETDTRMDIKPLPDCQGDAVQVTQVFANLIDNAINYRDKDRPAVITISGSADSRRTRYRVKDNGTGIAEKHQEKIFELFYRLNPKESEGEGIGLTMVRQILLRMGGEITVESKQGEGSVFIVSLPKTKENRS